MRGVVDLTDEEKRAACLGELSAAMGRIATDYRLNANGLRCIARAALWSCNVIISEDRVVSEDEMLAWLDLQIKAANAPNN